MLRQWDKASGAALPPAEFGSPVIKGGLRGRGWVIVRLCVLAWLRAWPDDHLTNDGDSRSPGPSDLPARPGTGLAVRQSRPSLAPVRRSPLTASLSEVAGGSGEVPMGVNQNTEAQSYCMLTTVQLSILACLSAC